MNARQALSVFLFIITLANSSAFAANPSQQVVLYATSWCGYCQKAREFLARNHIAYKEYDIEKSSEGRRQFKELRGVGVPLILVGTQEIRGWNPTALKAALARARLQTPAQAPTAHGVGKDSALAAPADDAYQGMSAVSFITPSSDGEHRYIIHLRNQRAIRVDKYWEEGDEIKYEKFGGIVGVQRKEVVKIEDKADGTVKRYKQR